MKITKTGSVVWSGGIKDGKGTNPEELIGVAHAGCFTMALAKPKTGVRFPSSSKGPKSLSRQYWKPSAAQRSILNLPRHRFSTCHI